MIEKQDLCTEFPFSLNNLDMQNYTLSLLHLCGLHRLISEARLLEIRSGLQEAFLETAAQFTQRASSSLPKKRAELLYSSVFYQSDVYLLGLQSVQKSVEALQNMPFAEILQIGQQMILEIHRQNVRIFKEAYALRLDFPLFGYRYVMDTAFDEYFAQYSARFDARNCVASIDYPLLGAAAYALKTQGALFIREYYTGILQENRFCSLFLQQNIEDFLIAYGKLYGCAYSDLVFNLAEVLMNNLLAGVLLEKPLFSLFLTKPELLHLQQQFAVMSEHSLLEAVRQVFREYAGVIAEPECYLYLYRYLPAFAQDFHYRIQHGGLQHFLVCRMDSRESTS